MQNLNSKAIRYPKEEPDEEHLLKSSKKFKKIKRKYKSKRKQFSKERIPANNDEKINPTQIII